MHYHSAVQIHLRPCSQQLLMTPQPLEYWWGGFPSVSVGLWQRGFTLNFRQQPKFMTTLKGGIFQTGFYVIVLLSKISFGILKEVIFFLNMRAADMLQKRAMVSVCVGGCVCMWAGDSYLSLMHTVLLWFLCNIAHIFYLENHFPLHILNSKHENT